MTKRLDDDIRDIMVSIRRRHIVERIQDVVRHYGGEQTGVDADGTKRRLGSVHVNIAGGTTYLNYRTYGFDHEFLELRVDYGHLHVFDAVLAPEGAAFPNVDARRIMRGRGYTLAVNLFLPGVWLRALELRRLIRQDDAAKRAAERERLAREREAAKPKPYREDDREMAKRFDLDNHDIP